MATIRAFHRSDAGAVSAMMNSIVDGGEAFVYETPFDDAGILGWVASWSHAFVAVDGGGQVVGAYVFRPNQPGRGSHVANAAYLVDPAARGAGVGRMLGTHSLAEARQAGFSAMQFNAVVATNEPAVRLWTGLGFTIIGRVPAAFRLKSGGYSDLLVMHRAL